MIISPYANAWFVDICCICKKSDKKYCYLNYENWAYSFGFNKVGSNRSRDLLYKIHFFEKSVSPILILFDYTITIGRVQNCYYKWFYKVDSTKSYHNEANPLNKVLTKKKKDFGIHIGE